jgi:integrase
MPRRPRNLTRSIPWGAGSVRQRGDEWEARWTEGDARPSRPFPTKEAAEDFLIARHRRKLRGGYIAPVEMTVADLLESYIERSIAYGKWKPATINLNRRLADHHILPTLKDLRVIEVEPPRLQRWVDTLARTLSPATVSMCAALLSAAFKQAVTLTIIPSNPCSVVSRPKVEQKPMVTWSVEDIAKVDAFLRDEPKWLAVYRLMLTTGMRPGELYALTWSDLDFEQNIVRIRRTITNNAEGKRWQDALRCPEPIRTGRTARLAGYARPAGTQARQGLCVPESQRHPDGRERLVRDARPHHPAMRRAEDRPPRTETQQRVGRSGVRDAIEDRLGTARTPRSAYDHPYLSAHLGRSATVGIGRDGRAAIRGRLGDLQGKHHLAKPLGCNLAVPFFDLDPDGLPA